MGSLLLQSSACETSCLCSRGECENGEERVEIEGNEGVVDDDECDGSMGSLNGE